jgi:hypothetical protein
MDQQQIVIISPQPSRIDRLKNLGRRIYQIAMRLLEIRRRVRAAVNEETKKEIESSPIVEISTVTHTEEKNIEGPADLSNDSDEAPVPDKE